MFVRAGNPAGALARSKVTAYFGCDRKASLLAFRIFLQILPWVIKLFFVSNLLLFIHDARERLLKSRFGLLSDSMQVVEFCQPLLELNPKTIEEFLLELFRETILPMYQILLIDLVVW